MNVLLVITDEQAICESLRASLPDTDLLLFEATVDDALRRLISVRPDALILDDAPARGYEALLRLRQTVPDIPVIILASRGDAETLASFTLGGARECVTKPFACDDMRLAVSKCTNSAHAPAQTAASPVAPLGGNGKAANGRPHQALRWLSRAAHHMEDPQRLAEALVDGALDIFDAARCAVLVENEGQVRVGASYGIPRSIADPLRLSFSVGLMRWLEENACVCDRLSPRVPDQAVKEMQILGARMAAPIICRGQVSGALLIGEKSSGTPYSPDETELLTLLARCVSTAFDKAHTYRETAQQEGRLDTILSNMGSGVVTILPDGTIGMMNPSAERILQLSSSEMIGRSVQRLGSAFADVALRTLADGEPRLRQEVRDAALDATLGLSATPLGANQGVVVILARIPEAVLHDEEVTHSPFWEFLASRVAQEIKNPMVAVNTFAQLLPKNYDQEDFRDSFSQVMQQEVARINDVVETLFDFAQHPRMARAQTDVNHTIRSALQRFEDDLEARSIKLHTELAPGAVAAEVDEPLFSKALYSVVQNSIDAMPTGGELSVKTSLDGDTYTITVSDTGEGVAEKDTPMIFLPFFSTREKGMGLGLTIANRIMRQHDGSLELRESTDEGSSFVITLPNTKVV